MNTDVEELLRDGMERFTAGVRAPAGLAHAAGRLHRRRLAARTAVACGTAAAAATALIVVVAGASGGPAQTGPGGTRARTAAYVINRVENALAGQHLVLRGHTTTTAGPTASWAYGPRNRFEEFTGSDCGHTLPSGACTHRGGSEPYLATGTALIGGKLTSVYVTYYDRKWSVLPPVPALPASACSRAGAVEMSGPPLPVSDWRAFIHATLACGAATVTGHVRVDGQETTKITGSPVTVRLKADYAKVIRERQLKVRWTLYVDPTTYLPVRMSGSSYTFGGPAPSSLFTSVTDVQWLPPTAANIASALVTIPAGFQQVSSPADQ
jgi:hypothetical protein